MARGKSIDDVLAEADQIGRVWEANPDFTLGELTRANFQTQINEVREARTDVLNLRTQWTEKSNLVNARTDALSKLNARIRGGYKAVYGPDSTQYEQAGGTRASERRSRKSSKKSS